MMFRTESGLTTLVLSLFLAASWTACDPDDGPGGQTADTDADSAVLGDVSDTTDTTDTADATDTGLLCPESAPKNGKPCKAGQVCTYGEDCCCGECHDSYVCTCENGSWGCYATDACLVSPCDAWGEDAAETQGEDATGDAGDSDGDSDGDSGGDADTAEPDGSPTCPEEEPIGVSGCEGEQECSYGQECCCGECYPSIVCNCAGGDWSCYATDACFIPGCPCHSDEDCADDTSCVPPNSPSVCGFCMQPEPACEGDSDCAESPGTVCDIPATGCFCESVPQCIPACAVDSDCTLAQSCVEGHCIDTPCASDDACPTYFSCTATGGTTCERMNCTADGDCADQGVCVNGQCHGQLGVCTPPVP